MKDLIDMDLLLDVCERDTNLFYRKVIKLGEEAGEVNAAFLELDGSPNVSASAATEDPRKAVIEETCDTILVAMDILYALGATDVEVREMMDRKLLKWDAKLRALGK